MVATVTGAVAGICITYFAFKHQRKINEAALLKKVAKAYLSLEAHLVHEKIHEKDSEKLSEDSEYLEKNMILDMQNFIALSERNKVQEATMDRLGVLLTIMDNKSYYATNTDELNRSIRFSTVREMNEV